MGNLKVTYVPQNQHRPLPVELPLSKSVALRVMVLNAVSHLLGHGSAEVPEWPTSEDVTGMKRAMAALSARASQAEGRQASDTQASYLPTTVRIGEGGAPMRFFTALAASVGGSDITVSVGKSLLKRPLKPLLDILHDAGARISCLRRNGYAPLRISGRQLSPGLLTLQPTVSSQFVSALMMASPLWGHGLQLSFGGEKPVSAPYIAMTARLMERFGCKVECGLSGVQVAPDACSAPSAFMIEPDWSAASYFYELALLAPGVPITFQALTPAAQSLQGDSACEAIFSLVGVRTIVDTATGKAEIICQKEALQTARNAGTPLELDLEGTPDLAPALTVGLCLAGLKFRFKGVAHLKHKETDRMAALTAEMRKLGYVVHSHADTMSWSGQRCQPQPDACINTYGDHRMAMAFAVAAAVLPAVTVENPGVVAKSYPEYWENLRRLGFITEKL